MTFVLPIVPVTYDSIDVYDFDAGYGLELVSGLWEVPTVRGEDTVIPAAPGRLEQNRINDVLPLELRGLVRASTASLTKAAQLASYAANLRYLRTLFRPDRDRADLVATLPGGTTLTISARPLNIVSNELVAGELAEISVSLEGYDDWSGFLGS